MAGYKVRQAASTAASEIDETKYHLNQRHLHHQLTGFPVQVDRLRDDVNTTTQVRNYDADTIEDIDGDDNNNQSKQAQESVICQESSNTDKIHCNVTLELEDSSCKSQKRQSIKVEPASSDVVKMSLKEPTNNKTSPSILNQPRAVRGVNGRTHERGNVTKRDAKKRMRCNDSVDNNGNKLIESHKYKELVCSCNRPPKSLQQANLNRSNIDEQNSSENSIDLSTRSLKSRLIIQHALVSLGENNGRPAICNKHMPWFGIDVGGSLVKVVFFDPKDASREEMLTLRRIRRYLKSSKPYGSTGKRDDHLEMPNCLINKRLGTLHFIRFATSQMPQFLEMAKNKQFADTINTVCATGGGACKYEQDIKKSLGITLHKTDELDSVIYGIHYIDKYNPERECYFLQDPLDDEKCVQVPYDFSSPYPYLVVNIGSGVSILAVYSSTSYSRISGSSIGGGTFLGLCCLLTQCKTFDEAIKLAKAGSSSNIDKLVKDIYGGDYPKFNLSGDTVASSFGHMNMEEKRKNVKREDLARALLEMVTINIGSIARMCAANENIDRVVFIGNFLRVNQLSMKLLSYAVNYWSKGAIKALFLEHEGYFGAVGCFVESTQGCRNQ